MTEIGALKEVHLGIHRKSSMQSLNLYFRRIIYFENEKIARTARKIHANENRSIEQMMKFREEEKKEK